MFMHCRKKKDFFNCWEMNKKQTVFQIFDFSFKMVHTNFFNYKKIFSEVFDGLKKR